MEEETVLIAPPQPAVTVTAQYPGTSGGPLPPYPGVPPAYGAATGYSQVSVRIRIRIMQWVEAFCQLIRMILWSG